MSAEILSVDPDGFDLGLRPAGKGGAIAPLRIGLRAGPPTRWVGEALPRARAITRADPRLGPQTREETLSIFSKLFQETYARQQGWQ